MRFVIDAKDTLMNMMYNRVKIVFRDNAITTFQFPSIYEDKDNEIKPFTAIKNIDEQRGISVYLTECGASD